jgi:hypothetical protein
MNKTGMNRFIRLACQILAAALLFLSTGPAVHAQNTQQKYSLKIYGAGTEICVGQSITPAVGYKLNEGQTDGGILPRFSFQATHGTVDPKTSKPGARGSGYEPFTFKATDEGDAKLSAQLLGGGASASTTVKVKECKYSYDLIVTLNGKSNLDGVILDWTEVIKSKGTYTPVAEDLEPLTPLVPNGKIEATLTVNDAQLPKQDECNVPATTWTGLDGSGDNTVKGKWVKNGIEYGVTIELNAVDVKHTPAFSTPCKHGTVQRTLPMSFFESQWVYEQLPAWGDVRQIKIDQMEQGVKRLNKSPGTSASYTAVLTVWRIK